MFGDQRIRYPHPETGEPMELFQNPAVTTVRSRGNRAKTKLRSRSERRRYGGRSHQAARVRALAAGFRAQLGDVSSDPIVSAAITRAAELTMLAEMKRAAAIRGEDVDLGDLIRLEGAARRAVADLRLPVVERDEKGETLAQYLDANATIRASR